MLLWCVITIWNPVIDLNLAQKVIFLNGVALEVYFANRLCRELFNLVHAHDRVLFHARHRLWRFLSTYNVVGVQNCRGIVIVDYLDELLFSCRPGTLLGK